MDLSLARAGRYARAGARWARLLVAGKPAPGMRVFYGHDRVPVPGERAAGGSVKMQKLAARFPNSPTDFSLLYIGTTWIPRDLGPLLRLARSVAGSRSSSTRTASDTQDGPETRPRRSTVRFAGASTQPTTSSTRASSRSSLPTCTWASRTVPWEVLPNAVDVGLFTPAERPPAGGPVLLLGGDQTQEYRLELALRTLAALQTVQPEARLLVTGRLVSPVQPLIEELGLRDRVVLLGEYAQREAPEIFRRAHLLLHTKVKDPCPTLVLEAMASGLPVVYPASGGTRRARRRRGRNRGAASGHVGA